MSLYRNQFYFIFFDILQFHMLPVEGSFSTALGS